MALLNLEKAAKYVGLSTDDLMLSRYRGLPPGKLGFTKGGELLWDKDDLLPPAWICGECGFRAKTQGGLSNHQRSHAA